MASCRRERAGTVQLKKSEQEFQLQEINSVTLAYEIHLTFMSNSLDNIWLLSLEKMSASSWNKSMLSL